MARPRQRKKPREVDSAAPAWMVTFSDLMTLLMCFFILLFSMSVIQEIKFKAAMGSLRAWLGFMPAHESAQQEHLNPAFAPELSRWAYHDGIPGEHLEVMTVDEGKKIVIGGKVLFAESSGRLLPGGGALLWEVADRIRGLSNRVEVRGHAAPGEAAVSGAYQDEWELGWARARTVAEFLITECNIPANRLRIASGGSADLAALNVLPEEASRNRRVEVVVTGEFIR